MTTITVYNVKIGNGRKNTLDDLLYHWQVYDVYFSGLPGIDYNFTHLMNLLRDKFLFGGDSILRQHASKRSFYTWSTGRVDKVPRQKEDMASAHTFDPNDDASLQDAVRFLISNTMWTISDLSIDLMWDAIDESKGDFEHRQALLMTALYLRDLKREYEKGVERDYQQHAKTRAFKDGQKRGWNTAAFYLAETSHISHNHALRLQEMDPFNEDGRE